jgi:hypothetical protein
MMHVIAHPEAPVDELGHPRTGPQVRGKAGRLRSLQEQRLEPLPVLRREFPWSSGCRPGPHRFATALAGRGLPASYAAAVHTHAPRDLDRHPSFVQQRERLQTSALQFLATSSRSHVSPPGRSIGHYLYVNQ